MVFVDASLIVAILAGEPDAEDLIGRLEATGGPYLVSPLVRIEAALALARRLARFSAPERPATSEHVARATALVDQFFADIEASEVEISGEVGTRAIEAVQIYGKIVAHPAKLNLGDCLAYACARSRGATIAYKGDDFVHTDLGW